MFIGNIHLTLTITITALSKHAGRNICHGSDSVESAEREIGLWFKEGINEWTAHGAPWIYE
jgi:Nucleoside diphosphate kinase